MFNPKASLMALQPSYYLLGSSCIKECNYGHNCAVRFTAAAGTAQASAWQGL